MTSDGVNSLVWNARNQLASMNLGANSFQYDPFGRRSSKTMSGAATAFLYDGINPVQEQSGATPIANLLSGLGVDEVFTRTDAVGARHFLADAQRIYRAPSLAAARQAFLRFRGKWQSYFPRRVRGLEKDLPELLQFFSFPRHRWRKLRTTNAIKRCFVEVRRRTRPMVCFVNVESVDRIISSIFNRFNEDWKNYTLALFTQAA